MLVSRRKKNGEVQFNRITAEFAKHKNVDRLTTPPIGRRFQKSRLEENMEVDDNRISLSMQIAVT